MKSTSFLSLLCLLAGTAAFAQVTGNSSSVPVYRLDNATTADHLYTIDADEADGVKDGYTTVGEAFDILAEEEDNALELHRCLNSTSHQTFLATNSCAHESLFSSSNQIIVDEGTMGYLQTVPSDTAATPLYRCKDPTSDKLLFTIDQNECKTAGYTQKYMIGYAVDVDPATEVVSNGPMNGSPTVTLGDTKYQFARQVSPDDANCSNLVVATSPAADPTSALQNLGGCLVSDPQAVALNNDIFIFATLSSGTIQYTTLFSGNGDWQDLGRADLSNLIALYTDGTEITIDAKDASGVVWERTLESDWESLNEPVTEYHPENIVIITYHPECRYGFHWDGWSCVPNFIGYPRFNREIFRIRPIIRPRGFPPRGYYQNHVPFPVHPVIRPGIGPRLGNRPTPVIINHPGHPNNGPGRPNNGPGFPGNNGPRPGNNNNNHPEVHPPVVIGNPGNRPNDNHPGENHPGNIHPPMVIPGPTGDGHPRVNPVQQPPRPVFTPSAPSRPSVNPVQSSPRPVQSSPRPSPSNNGGFHPSNNGGGSHPSNGGGSHPSGGSGGGHPGPRHP